MKTIEKEIGEYLKWCEEVRGMSAATLKAKKSVLLRFARETGVEGLDDFDNVCFNLWVECEKRRGVSGSALFTYNSVVVAMVRYFRELGREVPLNLKLVRTGKVLPRRARRFYTAEEIERVLMVAGEVEGLMIRILFETGMRIAELTTLTAENLEGRKVKFVGKGRKMREVYLTAATEAALREYLRKYGISAGPIWSVRDGVRTKNGEAMTVNTVRTWLRQAFTAAGIEGFYPHALRHSFATDLQRRGASVAEIKEMMGHANIATTERYLHGFDGRMQELFEKYRG